MSESNNQLTVVKQVLSSPAMVKQFQSALPKHVPVDQFVRVAMTMVSNNPDILKCDRESLYSSLMSCASLGLLPEPFLGQAYLVAYKGKCQLIIGYKGMIALARRSGDIASVASGIVYEKDTLLYSVGIEQKFQVTPYLDGDPGKPILIWCVVQLTDKSGGGYQLEVMTVQQIEKIRLASPSKDSPSWKNYWEQQARKVCIKRALKYAPLSTDLQSALDFDNQGWEFDDSSKPAEREVNVTAPPAATEEKPKRQSRMRQVVDNSKVAPVSEAEKQQAVVVDEEPPFDDADVPFGEQGSGSLV